MLETASQLTALKDNPIIEKPTMPPIIEWVVDTGHPKVDARKSHNPAASKADIIPKTKTSDLQHKQDLETQQTKISLLD